MPIRMQRQYCIVNVSDQKYFLGNKKALHFCKALFYMVGLHGLEPWTKGL